MDTVYHYSPIKLKELCPPVKIKNFNNPLSGTGLESIRVSVLPSPIPIGKIEEMANNGFKVWEGYENLYLNEIKLSDLKKAFVFFLYESKKEPMADVNRVFLSERNKILNTTPDITDTEFAFFKYSLKTRIYHQHGLIYSSSEWNDFLNMLDNSTENWSEDIDFNIANGNKNQYASYIPHFNITVSDCIKVSKSYKIV